MAAGDFWTTSSPIFSATATVSGYKEHRGGYEAACSQLDNGSIEWHLAECMVYDSYATATISL